MRPTQTSSDRRSRRRAGALLLAGLASLGVLVSVALAAVEAAFECSPACEVTPGATVTFTSTSTSSSPFRNYEWDLDGDGLHGADDEPDETYGTSAQSVQRAFPDPGSYRVGLRVTNADAEMSAATRTVTVAAEATPPPPPPPGADPGPAVPGPDPLVPPNANGDVDRDGADDDRDLCPATPLGLKPIKTGCSLVDLIQGPGPLLEPAGASVGDALAGLLSLKSLRRPGRRPGKALARGLHGLKLAARNLDISPCGAAGSAGPALKRAKKGAAGISRLVARKQKRVVMSATRFFRKHPKQIGDSGPFELGYARLESRQQLAQEALGDLRDVMRLMQLACRSSHGKRSVTGRIASIDGYLARLDDGTALAIGATQGLSGLVPGAAVSAEGVALDGNVLLTGSLKIQDLATFIDPVCSFEPRIAPVQNFGQPNNQILYYDHRGYRDGSIYQLEEGMGIGAVKGAGCVEKDLYVLNVFLDYRDENGAGGERFLGLLTGTPGLDAPVRIPMDVDPAKRKATLRFAVVGIDCAGTDLGSCNSQQVVSDATHDARVRQQGQWGTAVYSRTRFSVEDGSATDFDIANLVDGNAPDLPGAMAFGVGYGATGGASSFPNAEYIVEDENFAVHDDVPAPDIDDYYDSAPGVPGGLFWAYMNGFRNGHPYHYVAKLPDIVTDVVSFCPGNAEDSYYRLPWKAAAIQKVTQGNSTNFSHQGGQAFAFDFKMPLFTPGRAPRGGVVDFVVESRTKNYHPIKIKEIDDALWIPGNVLRVVHQDGTFSWYEHMIPNGVLVDEESFIERGDTVIIVGNTGNSTGPHLHWHVTTATGPDTASGNNASRGGTVQVRFELSPLLPPNMVLSCSIPGKGSWISTNAKPGS